MLETCSSHSIVSYNQNNSYTTPTELVGEGAHSFAILDIIVTLLLSSVLHAKILGLLFTNYVIFIPLIYIALFMMLKGNIPTNKNIFLCTDSSNVPMYDDSTVPRHVDV